MCIQQRIELGGPGRTELIIYIYIYDGVVILIMGRVCIYMEGYCEHARAHTDR